MNDQRRMLSWEPIYFDSFGAKCSSILVRTPDVRILIDPGAAEMQPSYPMSWEEKMEHLWMAQRAIEKAAESSDIIVISHYHYDHHTPLDIYGMRAEKLYKGKTIYAKDPNQYINESQWERARLLWSQVLSRFGKKDLSEVVEKPKPVEYPDPMEDLPLSRERDWGPYRERKKALVEKGRRWFQKLVKGYWLGKEWIPELELKDLSIYWADGKELKVGDTKVKFSEPRFHGLEFDRVGWVFSIEVEHQGKKLVHTSDLEGVQVDDYREAIIKSKPDVLIVDGPPTYLFGYMLNRINLNRSIENLCKIVKETRAELIILDHHLLREPRYQQRLKDVYSLSKKLKRKVMTAAEYLGKTPKVLELSH